MWRIAMLVALLYRGAVCAQESNPEVLFQEAQQAQQAGKNELAVEKYQALLKAYPEVVAARANLGVALVALGRYEEAVEQYTEALKQLPGNPDLRLNLALAYYKGSRWAEATEQFRSLLPPPGQLPSSPQEATKNVRIALLLGDCYLRLNRNDDVISLLLPYEEADPQNLGIAWTLGSALIHAGRNREGVERIEKVAAQKQLPEAYAMAGEAHLRLEEFDQARRNVDTALRLNPNLPGIDTLSGMVSEYASDLDGAEIAYHKAIQANPDDFEAHMRLGAVLYELRKLDEARKELDRALQLDATSGYARFELAKVEMAQGQFEAAVKDFENVAQEIPQWLPPHVQLTALYYRLKRPEDGAREKQIVDRITEEERLKKTKSSIILPQLPSR